MPLSCDYQVRMSLGEPGRLWPMAPNLAPGRSTAHEFRGVITLVINLLTSPVSSSHTATIEHQVPDDDQFAADGVLGRSRYRPIRSEHHHQRRCSHGAHPRHAWPYSSSTSRPRTDERALSGRGTGPVLLNCRGTRMDRHVATRRLHWLAGTAGIRLARTHPHMLRPCIHHDHAGRRRRPARRPDRRLAGPAPDAHWSRPRTRS